METAFTGGFFEYAQILIVALFLYVLIFAMLKKVAVFDDVKVNSFIALLAAIIVSFSGVVTYVVSYAVHWFAILFIVIFMVILLMLFLGIKFEDITSLVSPKVAAGVFVGLFLIVLVPGFFAVTNLFDTSSPQDDPYEVNTSSGFSGTVVEREEDESLLDSISSELLGVAFFLLILGVMVILLGR